MVRCPHWCMKNPGRQAGGCTACLDDSPVLGGPALRHSLLAGLRFGNVVWFFAPPASPADRTCGHAVCGGYIFGLARTGIRCLPGGFAAELCRRPFAGWICLGKHHGKAAAAALFPVLAKPWKNMEFSCISYKNFFEKSKNFVCICGKMGYNRME